MEAVVISVLVGVMALIFIGGFIGFIKSLIEIELGRKRREDSLKTSVLSKLSAKVGLSAVDLERLCNAYEVDTTAAKRILDQIFAEPPEEADVEFLEGLRPLLAEIEANQPYDHLPIEVRASLVRLDELIAASGNLLDQAILPPIHTALANYVELTKERKRLNVHKNIAYLIGGFSIVIGAATLYLTPSEQQLANSVAAELHEMSLRANTDDTIE